MWKKLILISFIFLLILGLFLVIKQQEFIHNKYYRGITKLLPLDLKIKIINSNILKSYYINSVAKKTNKAFESSNDRIKNLRSVFIKNYLLKPEQINISKINFANLKNKTFKFLPDDKFEVFKAHYYDIDEYGILEYSNTPKNKLLIYHQGHRGNPYKFENFIKIRDHYKKKGFDVFALSMPVLGFNRKNINFPGIDNTKGKHEIYHKYFDKNLPEKKPLSVFISGNYYLIKNLIENRNYNQVYYIGVSGGGWFVTLLSSFITEIKNSYSFASLVPLELRYLGVRGDWEASKAKFYKDINYYDLFNMTTLDKNLERNRNHYLIYNKLDDCCFSRPWSEIMERAGKEINYKNFIIKELDVNKHTIDLDFLFREF